ncbi:MAG: hypothetical protein NZ898_09455 [Myxococcota bacterium]|nr:hypothetical protein [Myxococcota bacterium]MDW8362786.1 hypothetical protein [Myxococcales bacterium]
MTATPQDDPAPTREPNIPPASPTRAVQPATGSTGAQGRGLLDRWLARLTLRRAFAIEPKLRGEPRAAIAEALELADQKAAAAELLWNGGQAAEALRLLASALDATARALEPFAGALGDASDADRGAHRGSALRALLGEENTAAQVESVLLEVGSVALPVLEREVTPRHEELWNRWWRARTRLAEPLREATRTRAQLRAAVAVRLLVPVAVLAAAAIALAIALDEPEGMFAEASGVWAGAADFDASKAIDGSPTTAWLAPDGMSATLVVRIHPPRSVRRIRLLNAYNAPHYDRGTKDYALELLSDDRVLRRFGGRFERTVQGVPSWVDHDVGVDGVDRIRFVAYSYHGLSAGLAEMRLEP